MAEHAIKRQKSQKKDARKAARNTEEEPGARILALTSDPGRRVVIVPGCHSESMRQEENAYFFEDGDALVRMVVEGGTVEYRPADRTYVVRLTDGRRAG